MSFSVKLLPSGRTFAAAPGQSILDAALAEGLALPYGCRMGTCSTCKAHVVEGDFDFGGAHLAYLPQEERDRRRALLCQARACSDLVIEAQELAKLRPPQRFAALVKRLTPVAEDVMVIELRLALHQALIFVPGQFIDLLLDNGERRSYSIASASAAPMGVIDLTLHVRHLPGGLFTDQVFAGGLKPRSKLEVEGPLGTFFLRDGAEPLVMLASGTGYAPIRSILLDLFAKGDPRQIVLYWGGRRAQDLYALQEVQQFVAEHPNLRFVPVLSEPQPQDHWSGRTGLVHQAVMADLPDLSGHQVYACGAPVMVAAARNDFIAHCRLPDNAFYADAFVSRAEAGAGTS